MSYWWICAQCAGSNGGKMPEGHLATFHNDFCSWCGEFKPVTEPHDWEYPICVGGRREGGEMKQESRYSDVLSDSQISRMGGYAEGYADGRASRDGLWNVCCTGNRVPEKAWYKFCPSCGKNVEVKK